MSNSWSRRTVLSLFGSLVVPTGVLVAQDRKRPDPIDPATVMAFVGAAHGNLEKTKEMLETMPGLLNATVDHGGGDFEAAISGAGHMGRRDIAEYLISRGAKTTIFVHAMMGDLEIVKAMLVKYPNLRDAKGPHGIPLMVHAVKGGELALPVLDYLKSLE